MSESPSPDVTWIQPFTPPPTTDPPMSAGRSTGEFGPGTAPEVSTPVLAPPLEPGELGRLAHYRVVKLLGQGGMGLVYQAEDIHLHRPVALKVMLPSVANQPQARERFLREARATAALKHDHIVTIYQVGEDRGIPFIAMEFLRGLSLEQWLAQAQRPSLSQVLRVGREAARGLAAAHAAGLVHRDIKPANLWLEAPRGRVKLLDFGLCSVEGDARLTHSGAVLGTPQYMAPEQAQGEPVDHRCDLFSLGCVLYLLATGEQPFKGKSVMAVLTALALDTPTPVRQLNPEAPPALAALVERLMAKDPAGRPSSAQAVVEELKAISRTPSARETTGSLPIVALAPRRRSRAAAVALLAGLLLFMTVVLVRGNGSREVPTAAPGDNTATVQPREKVFLMSPPATPGCQPGAVGPRDVH